MTIQETIINSLSYVIGLINDLIESTFPPEYVLIVQAGLAIGAAILLVRWDRFISITAISIIAFIIWAVFAI